MSGNWTAAIVYVFCRNYNYVIVKGTPVRRLQDVLLVVDGGGERGVDDGE